MVWKLIRVRWWLLKKQWLKQSNLQKVLSTLFLIGLIGAAVLGLVKAGHSFQGPQGITFLTVLIPSVSIMMLFFIFIQLSDILYQLYLAPDIHWAILSPLPRFILYLGKIIECSMIIWLPTLASLALLIALGIAQQASWFYYPAIILVILSFQTISSILGILAVMVCVRIVPPKKMREFLSIFLAIASIGGILIQQSMIRNLSAIQPAMETFVHVLFDPGSLLVLTGGSLADAGILMGLAYWFFEKTYFSGFSEIQVAPVKSHKKIKGKAAARSEMFLQDQASLRPVQTTGFDIHQESGEDLFDKLKELPAKDSNLPLTNSGSKAALRQSTTATHKAASRIMWKELIHLRRDVRKLVNLFVPAATMLVLIIPMVNAMNGPLKSLQFWLLFLYSSLFGINSAQMMALTAFLSEGKRYSWFARSPIKPQTIFWSKFWVMWLASVLPWVLMLTGAGVFLELETLEIIFLNLGFSISLLGSSLVCLSISARQADFSTLDPLPKVLGVAGWITLIFCFLSHLLVFLLAGEILIGLFPGSTITKATLAALGSIQPISAFFIHYGGFFVIVTLLAIGVFGFVLIRFQKSAIRRLENVEF